MLFSRMKGKLRVLGCGRLGFLMSIECQKACHKSQEVVRLRRHVGPLCIAQNLLSVGPGCLPDRSHAFGVRTLKYWIFFPLSLAKNFSWLSVCSLLLLFTLGVAAFQW